VAPRRCPYCAEAIEPVAIVCPHCTRDLLFAKPLMDQIDALSERVTALETSMAEMAQTAQAKQLPPQEAMPAETKGLAVAKRETGSIRWIVPIVLIVSLVAAHALLIVLLDTRLVYLRLLSIGFPFVAGFLFRRGAPGFIWIDVVFGLAAACLAISGMLWNVARADGVPLLPADREEWIETFQYGLSIALGFLSGTLLRRVVLMATSPDAAGSVITKLARAIAKDIVGDVEDASFEKRLKKVESLITSGVAIGAAILSGLLGLSRFLS